MLRSVYWYVVIDVSGRTVGHFFKGNLSGSSRLLGQCEDGTDRFSRNRWLLIYTA